MSDAYIKFRAMLHAYAALCDHDQTHSCLPECNQAVGALASSKHAKILLHVSNAEASAFHRLQVACIVIYHIPGTKMSAAAVK
jgi:hypothetical protein